MNIFDTVSALQASSLQAGQNVKVRGLNTLLDGGNAEYYVQSLADYGGVAPTDATVDVSLINGNVAVKLASNIIPFGAIMLWSGSVGSIPTGWALCDGITAGTPDLRGQFVVGAGATYSPDDTGGTSSIVLPATTGGHQLTEAEIPSHSHISPKNQGGSTGGENNYPFGTGGVSPDRVYNGHPSGNLSVNFALTQVTGGDSQHSHTLGSLGANANLPPYYALAYIMFVGDVGQQLVPIAPEGIGSYINVSGVVTLDAQFGAITVFEVQPNANITDLSVSNLPTSTDTAYGCAIKIISDGVPSTVTFGSQFNWAADSIPTLTTILDNWDWIVAFSVDQGVSLDAELSIAGLD